VVFGVLALVLVGLAARLGVLLRDRSTLAAKMAERQQRRVIPLPGRPGSIYARTRGGYVLLAGSERVPSCFADPFLLADEQLAPAAAAIGDALRIERQQVLEAIRARRRKRFAWIKRGITDEEAAAVAELDLQAVGVMHEWRRYYPSGRRAAAVVGFCRRDGEGGAALELALKDRLAASDGRRVVLADARQRPIWTVPDESRPPRDGQDVYLCLDAIIQGYLEQAVAESLERFGVAGRTWAAGVVIEPHTGEVLAMASLPTFDPNDFDRSDLARCVNRAVSVPYEPGSVMKPLFAAAGVDAGLMTYRSTLFCENGVYRVPRGGTIRDHGQSYGEMTLEEVVVRSSNIGMAKVGLLLGNARLHEAARRFGLGEQAGIELPAEDAGIIRDLAKWNTYSTPRVPFGQEMSVTVLQLACAFSALVNGGELLRPRLVDHVRDAAGDVVWRSRRQVRRRVLTPRTSAQTLRVLQAVVERGTGKRCRLSRWSSFGKTGTAQVPGPGGYMDGAYVATFAGGAPAGRARVLCVISVFRPDAARGYYGAAVAAPYVRDVLEKTLTYLRVAGDQAYCGGAGAARGYAAARR
jgi:cell division protein FtsI/penicillin-binding protein 2